MENQFLDLQPTLDTIPNIARIGLLALASDFCLEDHLRLMLPPGMQVFTNRITNHMPLIRDTLKAMEADIARAAAALLPGGTPHCFLYGCTSGTAAIGHEKIVQHIHQAIGSPVPVVTPLKAAFEALHALHVQRISLLTPYNAPISHDVAEQFSLNGFSVDRLSFLNMDDDYSIYRVSLDTWHTAAQRSLHPKSEALFISCTSTRASLLLEELEVELGLPVLSSNQVLAYATCTALQHTPQITGYGQLLNLSSSNSKSAL